MGSDVSQAEPAPTIGRSDATRVAVATGISAATSLLVQVLVTRLAASPDDATLFITFWSTLFVAFGLLSGISVETTRTVTSARALPDTAPRGPRVGVVGTVIGAALGVVAAAAAPWWGPAVFPRNGVALALLIALGTTGYALHSVLVGALAGAQRWQVYSALIGSDSMVRFGAVLAVAALGASVLGMAAGAAAAAFTWLLFCLVAHSARTSFGVRADVPARPLARRLIAASVANGASAVIAVGFPTLLSLTTPHDLYRAAAPFLVAISLTRAPLMIPLTAYQGVAVSHFVRHRDRGLRPLFPIARAVVGVGAVGAALAWLVGPRLLELVLGGPDYRVSGLVLAGLVLAAAGLALLTLTGAVCQALTRHGAFVTGWLVAVVVTVAVLLCPGSMEARSVAALALGPMAGIVTHLAALHRREPSTDAVETRTP